MVTQQALPGGVWGMWGLITEGWGKKNLESPGSTYLKTREQGPEREPSWRWPGLTWALSILETHELEGTAVPRTSLQGTLEKLCGVGLGPQELDLTGGPQIALRGQWPGPRWAPFLPCLSCSMPIEPPLGPHYWPIWAPAVGKARLLVRWGKRGHLCPISNGLEWLQTAAPQAG